MAILDNLRELITGVPAIKGAVFLKEDSDAEKQLEKLQGLLELADEKTKKQIEEDIRNVKYGIEGEKQIAYELKASFYPMIVLHDLHLELGGCNGTMPKSIDELKMVKGLGEVKCQKYGDDIIRICEKY